MGVTLKPARTHATDQVTQAVAALLRHLAKERAGKSTLFEEEDVFSLARGAASAVRGGGWLTRPAFQVIALKKTPGAGKAKPHRMCVACGALASKQGGGE